jgi:hypothetical protein
LWPFCKITNEGFISFRNPALVFHLLRQPFVQQADEDNASCRDKEEGSVQPAQASFCKCLSGILATISARPPNRYNNKLLLTSHADFKSVYKPKPS